MKLLKNEDLWHLDLLWHKGIVYPTQSILSIQLTLAQMEKALWKTKERGREIKKGLGKKKVGRY